MKIFRGPHTALAQFLTVCRASILAETLCLSSPFSGQSREKRRISEKWTALVRDQLQPSTHADKLSDLCMRARWIFPPNALTLSTVIIIGDMRGGIDERATVLTLVCSILVG